MTAIVMALWIVGGFVALVVAISLGDRISATRNSKPWMIALYAGAWILTAAAGTVDSLIHLQTRIDPNSSTWWTVWTAIGIFCMGVAIPAITDTYHE